MLVGEKPEHPCRKGALDIVGIPRLYKKEKKELINAN
jgi:hypothetical protein